MKRILLLILICVLMAGCGFDEGTTTIPLSSRYEIGDEVELGGVMFNVYKINDVRNELYLLAQNSVAQTVYTESDTWTGYYKYTGSLVEYHVNLFVEELKDKGITIKSSGIIDKDDLYALGFVDSETLSGRPYLVGDNTPEFVTYVDNFWLGGYCKYDTMSWVYCNKQIETESLDNEYGVRPSIVIDASELEH